MVSARLEGGKKRETGVGGGGEGGWNVGELRRNTRFLKGNRGRGGGVVSLRYQSIKGGL